MRETKYRFLILRIVMALMLAAIAVRLFNLQIIEGDKYLQSASSRLDSNIVSRAPRGDIMDRYGRVLVTNETGYSVTMKYTTSDDGKLNSIIRNTVTILSRAKDPYESNLQGVWIAGVIARISAKE